MTDTTASVTPASQDTSFFGHPKGLAILFFTEMWERFSYYGMRGLLIIYLTQHFLFSDERSAVMYGAYTALVYVMTIVGGSLADRYLGQRKAVTFGAILLVLGHFGMAFEGSGSRQDITVAGTAYELQDEGRGDRRRLYIDYEGERSLLVFRADSELVLTSENGDSRRFLGERYDAEDQEVEREAAYVLITEPRGFIANLCSTFGITSCVGDEPPTVLQLPGEGEFPVVEGEESRSVEIGGVIYALEENTIEFLEIVNDQGTTDNNNDDVVIDRIENENYTIGEPVQEQLYVNILYLSLALIIAGVGYLKANISTIVGTLYGVNDKRRDSGFTLFYMGINLGSFLSSITVGIIGIVYGWAWGFGLAGIGMLAGLLVFLWGQKYLGGAAEPPDAEKLKKKALGPISVEMACYLAGLGIIAVSMALVMNSHLIPDSFVGILGLAVFAGLVLYSIVQLKGAERNRMFAAIYFVLAQIPFWALFEQAGSSLNLFTDRLVDKNIFGWSVPAPVFQSLNAGFIFIFAPIIAWLWLALAKRNMEPSTPVKFAIGVFGVGLGFLALVAGMESGGSAAMTAVVFIFLIYWIHTMAELMLSPVGLSAVTKLAPARVVGMTMGAWFLYSGLSNYLAGVIASSTGAETVGGQLTNVAAAKATYASVYTQVGIIAILIALGMLLISPIIKKLMGSSDGTLPAHPEDTEAGGPSMDRISGAP